MKVYEKALVWPYQFRRVGIVNVNF
jgi:hypothetical protein